MICCSRKVLLVLLQLTTTVALNLDQCMSGWVQVKETSQRVENVLSCTNIPAQETVHWQLSRTGQPMITIGSCPPSAACTLSLSQENPLFTISRPSSTVSHLSLEREISRNLAGVTFSCYSGSDTSNIKQCTVDIVFPAEGVTCEVQFNSPPTSSWTVSGRCAVTKIYSSRNTYYCTWYQFDGSSSQPVSPSYVTMTTTQSSSSPIYYSASCSLSGQLIPISNGSYTYTVAISPGSGNVTAIFTASNVVGVPSTPINNCATDYVPEYSRLNCTCTSDYIGSPVGRLTWEGMSSAELVVDRVSRSLTNKIYTCQLWWNSAAWISVYTLRVAYGPDPGTTSILGPSYLDTDGSRELNLSCFSGDVSPTLSFTWDKTCSGQGQKCSITPQPTNDVEATCYVTNAKNNGKSDSTTTTIIVNYPPTTPPHITPSVTSTILYMNDSLTLNCEVNGGKPAVSSVNLTCDHHKQEPIPGERAQLVVTSLRPDDHQTTCTCGGVWRDMSLYRKTNKVTLTVHSPPTAPSISIVSPALFPFMERDNPILACSSAKLGVPAAHFHWSGNMTDDEVTEGSVEVRLQLRALTRIDDGRNISCSATNDYTDKRAKVTPSTRTIRVYYKPDINFTPLSNNQCTFSREPSTCTVREGEAVHVLCQADSNPEVDSVKWVGRAGGGTNLNITVADRYTHTDLYNCTAVTVSSPPDSRLPLTGTRALTVFVTYLSSVTSLTANDRHDNLTVSEGETIHLTCQAAGQPTPSMQIVIADIQPSLNYTTGGQLTMTNLESTLEYRILKARCEDTGVYSCVANNSQDAQSDSSIVVYVRCQPRNIQDNGGSIPSVDFIDQPVTLTFTVVAVPEPHLVEITFRGKNGTLTGSDVAIDVMQGNCRSVGLPYKSVCVITVKELKRDKEGFYVALLNNSVGILQYTFEVKFKESVTDGQAHSGRIVGGVVGGIAAAVVAIAVVVIVIFIMRKRKGRTNQTTEVTFKREHRNPAIETRASTEFISPYENVKPAEVGVSAAFGAAKHYPNENTGSNNPYATLVMADVGLQSTYETVGQTQKARGSASTSPYDTLVMEDVGLKSVYETVGKPWNRPAP